jgi:dTDP-L-rhamnose 4-epimerase
VKKVLITGGAGFIGQKLVAKLLSEKLDLVVIDSMSSQIHGDNSFDEKIKSSQLQMIRGDICDLKSNLAVFSGVDAVVHLAAETGTAQSMYEIARYNEVNSQGTAVLLDCLVNHSNDVKKIVLASSRSVYGEGSYECKVHGLLTPEPRDIDALKNLRWEPVCPNCGDILSLVSTKETASIKPASVYAATKYAQEDLIKIGCSSLGIAYSILRFQNVYGRGQSLNNPYTGILSIFSTRIRQKLSIPIFEDGLESRDFIHVNDVVEAIYLSLTSKTANNRTFNVGSGTPTSVFEIANLLFKVFDGHEVSLPQVTNQFRVGDIRHCYADISEITNQLGWKPQVSLEQGLDDFSDWVKSQPLPMDGLDMAMQELRSRGMTQ